MLDLNELLKELQTRAEEVVEARVGVEALFSSIGDGVITTDENGIINRVNKTTTDLLGFSEKELIGKWFPKVIVAVTEDNKPIHELDRPITRAFLTGKPVSERVFYITKDKSSLPVFMTVSPTIMNNKPIGAVEIFRDMSYEHEVDRMKSEFISLASHQLRTPLSTINTYAHMLSAGYAGTLTGPQNEFTEVIKQAVDHMNELIDTLLDISRIETGRLTINPQKVDFLKIVEKAVEAAEDTAKAKAITMDITSKASSVPVISDPLLLKEVVSNFLSNALKYTPEKGRVLIKLEQRAGATTLSVKDNGYGIPKKFQENIFVKFYRSPNIMSKDAHGTGLGLYLVKLIADALGGKVWFKSTKDKGSTFYFWLPKAKES